MPKEYLPQCTLFPQTEGRKRGFVRQVGGRVLKPEVTMYICCIGSKVGRNISKVT